MRVFKRHNRLMAGLAVVCGLIATSTAVAAVVRRPTTAGVKVETTRKIESTSAVELRAVVVTARRVKENLQHVPDSIITFTPTIIKRAGIRTFQDFANLVPSLNFGNSCAFECGQAAIISMRGVGNGQQGWPSVAYIVDGVPATSLSEVSSGAALNNIKRITVLRGPQSALYGFNAIAGAILITTKQPTNHWEGNVRLLYGNGNNRQLGGEISGPLIQNKLLFKINASYRDDNGLIRSARNGADLDFKDWRQVGLELLYKPFANLKIDLRGNMDRQHNGAVFEEVVPSEAYANDFNAPYTNPYETTPGVQNNSIDQWSAHIKWNFDSMSLISVTAFTHADFNLPYSNAGCYQDTTDPIVPAPGGGAQCIIGPAYGDNAAPGQIINDFYTDLQYYRTVYQDLRLASHNTGPLKWTIGVSALYRRTREGFNDGVLVAPVVTNSNLTLVNLQPKFENLFRSWHKNFDNWWGVYGQVIWNVTHRLQLTVAGRYDEERYASTAYTNRAMNTVLPFETARGPENTQHRRGSAFQPKGSVSYRFTPNVMGYATVSRGFRAGYFLNGEYTLPEETTNYELGIKSTIAHRIRLNADVFRILYYKQQFTALSSSYPFLISTTIPLTRINGVEIDPTIMLSRFVRLGLGVSYLNAEVSNHTASPNTPKLQAAPTLDVTVPIANDWSGFLHIDDRYDSYEYLQTNDQQYVGAVNLLNVRLGVENGRYSVSAFVRNAADRRYQPAGAAALGPVGWIRFENEPRSYGIELHARLF